MGVPWKRIFSGIKGGATLGAALGVPFAPQLIQGIHVAEAIPGLKGPQKREAAKAIAEQLVGDEGLLARDPELARLADAFCDAYVALIERIAVLRSEP